MKTVGYVCIAWLCLVAAGRAQELTTAEFPSEDEIYEAFVSGEIEYDEFIQLLEIAQDGIDSTDQHLLDLVPNVFYFQGMDSTDTLVNGDQAGAFAGQDEHAWQRAAVRYTYYQLLQEPSQSRYNAAFRSRLNGHWDASMKFRRDLSGRERVTARTLVFRSDTGAVRKAQVGSFSQRIGLGTVFGYTGKLFRYQDNVGGESFAFPDFGGFNGACAEIISSDWHIIPLVSMQRDSSHELLSGGTGIGYDVGSFTPLLVVGYTRLSSRLSGRSVSDYKTAINLERKTAHGSYAAEYCFQSGYRSEARIAVMELSQHLSAATIQAAAWTYGDDYLSLSGGSKTVSVPSTTVMEEVDFSFSDKRSGQDGGLLKTALNLGHAVNWSNSVLAARRSDDSSTIQWLSRAERWLSEKLQMSASVLVRSNQRAGEDKGDRRVQSELRYAAGSLAVRCAIGHTTRSAASDYLSCLVDTRVTLSQDMKLQFWSNLGRLVKGSADYWYTFARTEQQLFDNVSLATKLMYRYDRSTASARKLFAVNLEVSAGL